MKRDYDLLILGSGPGGYVAAIRASQLGFKVGVIEKNSLGGVCLNWGCIPTKALLKNASYYRELKNAGRLGIKISDYSFDWGKIIRRSRTVASRLSKGVELLFKQNQVDVIPGKGKLLDNHTMFVKNENLEKEVTADNLIIATGARARQIPGLPFDGEKVISAREAMVLPEKPESILIVGAGAIGVEFAFFFNAFGTKVTLIEMLPQILPIEDDEISAELTKSFQKTGIKVMTAARVESLSTSEKGVEATITTENSKSSISADKALIAIGVQPNNEDLGLDKLGIETDRGWIKVNEYYQTNIEHVYAIGDIIGPPWLAHVASAEGIIAVEQIAGKNPGPLNYSAIPGCTYCQPQVASVGLTQKQAIEKGYELKIGRFPFRVNGKSIALGETEGLVKLIFDAKNDHLIGAHIIGSEATEMIAELTLALNKKLTNHDILKTVHAHPTLTETVMEAAADSMGEAIHI